MCYNANVSSSEDYLDNFLIDLLLESCPVMGWLFCYSEMKDSTCKNNINTQEKYKLIQR